LDSSRQNGFLCRPFKPAGDAQTLADLRRPVKSGDDPRLSTGVALACASAEWTVLVFRMSQSREIVTRSPTGPERRWNRDASSPGPFRLTPDIVAAFYPASRWRSPLSRRTTLAESLLLWSRRGEFQ
jgi:hypothetical protein